MSFAVWLTGLPASGKSAIARELAKRLAEQGVRFAVLESDVLRTQLTPFPRYDEAERDFFYSMLGRLARLLVQEGVSVVIDATGNRRAYRDGPRTLIANFAEVHVDTPLELCRARDPKGLYRRAAEGKSASLPGAQADYEPPLAPELTLHGDRGTPGEHAERVFEYLQDHAWL